MFVVFYSATTWANRKIIQKKGTLNEKNINFLFLYKFINTINTEASISFATCTNYRDSSRFQQTIWDI